MPLSTSSSNQRIPPAPYGKLWGIVLFLLAIIILFGEVSLRTQGHLKSVLDDNTRWSMEMDAVEKGKADVVLAGASRLQLGFVPSDFEQATGLKVANVTVAGGEGVSVLKYMAEQTSFNGLVICSLYEHYPLCMRKVSTTKDTILSYKKLFENGANYSPIFERNIRSVLQKRFVFFSANVTACILDKTIRPFYLRKNPDRSGQAYYNEMLSKEERTQRAMAVEDWIVSDLEELSNDGDILSKWTEAVDQILGDVRIIEERGGSVVFVRYPLSGSLRNKVETLFPRSVFWQVLAEKAHTVHYMDYPEIETMICPDGSHLNQDDAKKMTQLLVRVFASKGLSIHGLNL